MRAASRPTITFLPSSGQPTIIVSLNDLALNERKVEHAEIFLSVANEEASCEQVVLRNVF